MAGLNQECCEPAPPPAGGVYVCVGGLETFQHLTAYVTGSPHAKAAVIFASHALGFEVSNLRKLADKVAAAGYYVVVPDYFHGEPFVLGSAENRLARLGDWLKRHGPEKGFEDSTKVIEVLKSRGISTIGAVGFCWGAKVVVELLKGEDVKAGVLLHPSFVTVDDIKEVKVPLTILVPEIDEFCTPEIVEQFRAILSAKPELPMSHCWHSGQALKLPMSHCIRRHLTAVKQTSACMQRSTWLMLNLIPVSKAITFPAF